MANTQTNGTSGNNVFNINDGTKAKSKVNQGSESKGDVLSELYALRDDLKVRIHLAGLEAKQVWSESIEPEILALEDRAKDAASGAKELALPLIAKVRDFRDRYFGSSENNISKDEK